MLSETNVVNLSRTISLKDMKFFSWNLLYIAHLKYGFYIFSGENIFFFEFVYIIFNQDFLLRTFILSSVVKSESFTSIKATNEMYMFFFRFTG